MKLTKFPKCQMFLEPAIKTNFGWGRLHFLIKLKILQFDCEVLLTVLALHFFRIRHIFILSLRKFLVRCQGHLQSSGENPTWDYKFLTRSARLQTVLSLRSEEHTSELQSRLHL